MNGKKLLAREEELRTMETRELIGGHGELRVEDEET